jgi:hypothetical protein
MAVLRAALWLQPRRIMTEESHPPATPPIMDAA